MIVTHNSICPTHLVVLETSFILPTATLDSLESTTLLPFILKAQILIGLQTDLDRRARLPAHMPTKFTLPMALHFFF